MSPLLVTAVAHIAIEHWTVLEQALARAREQRSLPPTYVFHFSGSRPQIREAFFNSLARVPFHAHARVLDKRLWTRSYLGATTGDARIQDEIVQLMMRCPNDLVSGQSLIIDGRRSESRKITPLRTELNRRLEEVGRAGLRKIRFCPDDHTAQGAIIQLADMIAGALHDQGTVAGPYLSALKSRIDLV